MNGFLARSLLVLALLQSAFAVMGAVPPPDDHFTNRIVLQGNDASFAGTLSGATWVQDELFPVQYWPPASVWWTWTATDTGPVTLLVRRVNPIPVREGGLLSFASDALGVWVPTNYVAGNPSFPCIGCRVASLQLYRSFSEADVTFNAVAGTTYELQLAGSSGESFEIRLLATNNPILLQQPRDVTAAPGASALFTIMARGLKPFSYQWQRNDTDLPGQTGPMLALTNLDLQHAGTYRVTISNATGIVLSDPAKLTVTELETPPRLTAASMAPSNRFRFDLCAEMGRAYRVEISTNLISWFPARLGAPDASLFFTTSVVLATSPCLSQALSAQAPRQFVRASRYVPPHEECNLLLKELRFAKELWRRDHQKGGLDSANASELVPYLNQPFPSCPSGGYYVLDITSVTPWCSRTNHILAEPQ